MPEFMLDLHNQNINIRCNASEGCTDPTQGEIIDGAVQAGSITIAPTDPDVQTRAARMGAHLLTALNRNIGTFGRFAQNASSAIASGHYTLYGRFVNRPTGPHRDLTSSRQQHC